VKALLSENNIQYEVQDIIKEPPSHATLESVASKLPNRAKDLLNPVKVQNNDPYYVAHIKDQEEQLSNDDYIDLYHRFPDLLIKPILTDGEKVFLGFPESELKKEFSTQSTPQ
jgi:arsenate reductase